MSRTVELNGRQIAVPSVHLNGTSEKGLTDPIEKVRSHLRDAHDTLRHASPHMRDFYTQENASASFALASEQHFDRISRIEVLIEELETLQMAIQDQGTELYARNFLRR